MKHPFKKSVLFVMIALTLAFSAVGVTPAHGGGGYRYAKPSATGTGDCGTWANACTLQTALNGAISGNQIWVMAGTHKPTTGPNREATFQLKNGVAVYGGFAGTETDLSQRDPAANVTILSGNIGAKGNIDNSYHVVTGATGATLDGFTITAGNANSDSATNFSGGGMFNYNTSPMLTNVTFSGNSAVEHGGGMYNYNSSPMLTNVTFSGNSATYNGGGMYNYNSSPTLTNVTFSGNTSGAGGGMYNYYFSSPTLTNVTFSDNSATYNGGGMYNSTSSSPTLTNVTFSGNSADYGGGMYNDGSSPTLTNVAFSSNSADYGGGMYNYNSSSPTLTNVAFSSNSATYNGGGMRNQYSNPTLTNVTFSGNSADYVGGMTNYFSSPTLTNVTFSGNSANYLGGGMRNSGGSPTLTNVTFSDNSADYGGGMYNDSSSNPTIRNTVFWGNTAISGGAQIYNSSGSTPVLNDNVVQGGCPDGSTCTHIISDDPKLGTLGDYGGSTQTIPLLAGSSAIDTGNDATCAADDQRGRPRPQGAQCDIGSYEANATLTVRSVGDYDGWILESGENTTAGGTKDSTATTFNLGDDAADKQYRSILSFNTATLPDTAVITKVTLKIRKQGLVGTNPFTILGGLKVDMRKPYFGTTVGLLVSDFQVAAGRIGVATFGATPVNNWYSALLNAAGRAYVNKTGPTQFRLYFAKDDNDDNGADYMKFFSGNYATASARPTLIIEYYVP